MRARQSKYLYANKVTSNHEKTLREASHTHIVLYCSGTHTHTHTHTHMVVQWLEIDLHGNMRTMTVRFWLWRLSKNSLRFWLKCLSQNGHRCPHLALLVCTKNWWSMCWHLLFSNKVKTIKVGWNTRVLLLHSSFYGGSMPVLARMACC